jgi:GAF domain-containing protein
MGVFWLHLVDQIDEVEFRRDRLALLAAQIRKSGARYRNACYRTEEQRRLQLNRSIGEPADPRAAERAIVKTTQQALSAAWCMLLPVQPGSQQFLETRTVVFPRSQTHFSAPRLGDAAFEALSKGYACRDAVSQDERTRLPAHVGSAEAAALRVGNTIASVLIVGYEDRRNFDRTDEDRLKRWAIDAGSVLYHATLTFSAKQSHRSSEFCRAIDPMVPLEQNLATLAEKIGEEALADKIVLYAYNPNSRTLNHPPGTFGIDTENIPHIRRVDPNGSLYRLHRLGQPLYVEEVRSRPEFATSDFARREGVRSLALLPIRSGDDLPVGMLYLNYVQKQHFDSDHVERLEALAQALLEPIRLTQRHEGERQVQKRQELLSRVTRTFAQCDTPHAVYQAVVSTAIELFPGVEYANVVAIESDGTLRQEAGYGWDDSYPNDYIFSADEGQHARFTIKTRKDTPVDDFNAPQPFPRPKAIRDRDIRSGLGVPTLLGDRRAVGAVLVHTKELRHFDESDRFFLRILATEAAFRRERLLVEARHLRALDASKEALSQRDEVSKLVAHQLSEPLNYLSCILDMATKREGHFGPLPPRLRHKLDIARGGLRNCWRIAQGILGPQLLEGAPHSGSEPCQVAPLILEIMQRWQVFAESAGKRVSLDIGNAAGTLAKMDELYFTLVIENLLSNAVRSARQNGTAGIVLKSTDKILIEVVDDGPGLEPGVRQWLSGASDALPPSGFRQPGRLGKGLDVTREILRRHGGSLQALEGPATRLLVTIPMV